MSKLSKQDRRRADFAEHIATECADDPLEGADDREDYSEAFGNPEGADDREGGGDPFEEQIPDPWLCGTCGRYHSSSVPCEPLYLPPSGNPQANMGKPGYARVEMPTLDQIRAEIKAINERLKWLRRAEKLILEQ